MDAGFISYYNCGYKYLWYTVDQESFIVKKSSNITQCMKNKHTLKYLWYVMDKLHCGIENVDSVDMNERALLRSET